MDNRNRSTAPRLLLSAMSDLLEWALSLVKSEESPNESAKTAEADEIKETSGS
jgi:hypothetical protein